MIRNGRKTIGVFVSEIYEEYQNILSKGISIRAKELGYNVAFFTNYGGYGQQDYDIGEENIVKLPFYEDFDGVIIAPDTLMIPGLEDYILEQVKKNTDCPVVSVRKRTEGHYNVLIDDYTVLEDIITHFIHDHGFTRLNFLSGPKESIDAQKRLESYKRILAKYNIPIEEERIYYGDFWKSEGYHAVDYWLNCDIERPQAIICANDAMAITVCKALEDRGIQVPTDIAVTGCDDIVDAVEYSPSITTARMPVFEMGIETVNKIHNHLCGNPQRTNSYMQTTTIYRESCGCVNNWYQENKERRKNHIEVRESLRQSITDNANMSIDLTGLTTLEEVNDKILTYAGKNVGFHTFYMCLRKDWDTDKKDDILNCSNEMIMEVGLKGGTKYNKIKFPRQNLIPPEFVDEEPMIFLFTMLHHQDNCFGYVAVNFEEVKPYKMSYQAWLINISNALENIRVHGELNRLIYRLEDIYIRDDLTGLYNRRGIDSLGISYLKQCLEKNVNLMTFMVDMDKLKYINDNYGHAKGDAALKVVAEALQNAADDDEICMRFGGDEFMVIGLDYDEIKLKSFIHKFITELNNYNQRIDEEYKVYVSYGWSMQVPDESTTLEECFLAADTMMYQQKYDKKAMNVRANFVTL